MHAEHAETPDFVHISHTPARLRDETGQAAVEFILLLPFLIGLLFVLFQFSAVFNGLNDMSQMAADGARLAAVDRFPKTQPELLAWRASQGDTGIAKNAQIQVTGCTPGEPLQVRISTTITVVPHLPGLASQTKVIAANAEMRREAAPTGTCPLSTP